MGTAYRIFPMMHCLRASMGGPPYTGVPVGEVRLCGVDWATAMRISDKFMDVAQRDKMQIVTLWTSD